METIKFIEDGDRFIAILTPRNPEVENTIRGVFSGVKTEGLYKAVPYKDVSDISDENIPETSTGPSSEEPEQAQIYFYRYMFRKTAKSAVEILKAADGMYEAKGNLIPYRKAVAKELEEFEDILQKYAKTIIKAMPHILGPFVDSLAKKYGMVKESVLDSVPIQDLVDSVNAAVTQLKE